MCRSGDVLPFASTKEEREAKGDPRLSLEERYPSHQLYVEAVARSAAQLVAAQLLSQRIRKTSFVWRLKAK